MRQLSEFKAVSSLLIVTALYLTAGRGAAAESLLSYCASAGNEDQTKPIPAALVGQAARLLGVGTGAQETTWVKETTVYRCMAGAVWICNYGANLQCAKADTRRTTPAISAYCRKHPNEKVVPAGATGHGMMHTWKCVQGGARIRETREVDERGFLVDEWMRLE